MNKIFIRSLLNNLLLTFLLLFLTACDHVIPSITPVPVKRTGWIVSMLSQTTCALHCWENITPGKTDVEEAMAHLEVVQDVKIRNDLSVKSKDVVFMIGDHDSGVLSIKEEIVSEIVINISNNTHLEVQEILNAFGEPDELLVYDCFGTFGDFNCDVRLYYEKKGAIISLEVPNVGNDEYTVEIQPNSRVITIYLLPTRVKLDTGQARSRLYPKYLFPWKGFTSYP